MSSVGSYGSLWRPVRRTPSEVSKLYRSVIEAEVATDPANSDVSDAQVRLLSVKHLGILDSIPGGDISRISPEDLRVYVPYAPSSADYGTLNSQVSADNTGIYSMEAPREEREEGVPASAPQVQAEVGAKPYPADTQDVVPMEMAATSEAPVPEDMQKPMDTGQKT